MESDNDCNLINFRNFIFHQDLNLNLHLFIDCDTLFIPNLKMDLVLANYYFCL